MFHGILLAVQDGAVYVLASRLFGSRAATYALALHATSWFVAYCGVRPYSNTVEACVNAVALAVWPWAAQSMLGVQGSGQHSPPCVAATRSRRLLAATALASVAVVLRPTAAVLWVPVVGRDLW